eukprot:scpid41716/ scgid5055/ UNC93-like protein
MVRERRPAILRDAMHGILDLARAKCCSGRLHDAARPRSGSAGSEAEAAAVAELSDDSTESSWDVNRKTKDARVHALNCLLMILGSMCVLTAIFGIQSLESSINSVGGLGQGCLGLLYGLGIISVTFLAPVLLRRLGPPRVLRLCMLPVALFLGAHFEVLPAVFLSACTLMGMFMMMFMASLSVITTTAAIDYASIYRVARAPMIARFSSMLFVGLVMSYFTGPLLSSLILENPTSFHGNGSAGHVRQCTDSKEKMAVADKERYELLIVYSVLVLVAFCVFCLVGNASETSIKARLASATAWQQITATLRLLGDFDMLMCIPWIFFTGMAKEMITNNYTQFFVAPCLGVGNVGFSIASFGAANVLVTALMPVMLRRTGRPLLAAVAASLEIAVLMVLLYWQRSPNAAVLYTLPAVWGAADAIWNVEMSIVIGVVFPSQQEAAYSNHRAWQGFGFGVSALYSSRFDSCFEQLRRKLWFFVALLLLSMILYAILEWRIRRADTEAKLDSTSDTELLQPGGDGDGDTSQASDENKLSP